MNGAHVLFLFVCLLLFFFWGGGLGGGGGEGSFHDKVGDTAAFNYWSDLDL